MKNKVNEIFSSAVKLLLKNIKFIWLFWGSNIVFGVVLSLPIYYMLEDNLLHSAYSYKLNFGFDYIWYLQFRELYKNTIGVIPYMIYGTVGVYVLIQVFFVGGLISVINTPKKNHYVDFFYGGVKYWYRFAKVLLISLVFYAIAFIINDYLGLLVQYLFSNSARKLEFFLRGSRYLLLIFLIGVVSLVSDYTKVSLSLRDSEKVLKEIIYVIKFLKKNFYQIFVIFFLVACLGAIAAIIYNIIDSFIPSTTFMFFLLAFILQQLLIIFRLLVKMLFVSTEVILYKDLNAQIIPTYAEEVD
ncbi:MAG: hypothetical protein NTX22_14235 [Ignavibacteriales bacterium]|nr:hypothetical protein [Ignavibacteriales bacterium]